MSCRVSYASAALFYGRRRFWRHASQKPQIVLEMWGLSSPSDSKFEGSLAKYHRFWASSKVPIFGIVIFELPTSTCEGMSHEFSRFQASNFKIWRNCFRASHFKIRMKSRRIASTASTQRSFYTQRLLHIGIFTQRRLYTEELLHRKGSAHGHFDTQHMHTQG